MTTIHDMIDIRLKELHELFGLLDLRKPTGERLTEKELQVATLAAVGLSNREIGLRLFMAVDTVKTHLRGSFDKLGVRRRTQLQQALRGLGDGA